MKHPLKSHLDLRGSGRIQIQRIGGDESMILLQGSPSSFFQGIELPVGVDTVVVSSREATIAGFTSMEKIDSETTQWIGSDESAPAGISDCVPAIDPQAYQPGARARAILKGIQLAEDDLRAAGGTYSLEETQAVLHGVSRQAVEKRVQDGSLLAVPGPSNRRRYPVVQFAADGTLIGGLKQVRQALRTKNPWTALNFLVQPDPRLEHRRPIDLLRAGKLELVIEAARNVGEQGG